ncbi:hypothetical protein V8E54_010331 [Elaphomyces granulatus]
MQPELSNSHSAGLQYPNKCRGNITDIECCLLQTCDVPEGSGYCRDLATQTCDQGKFFAGGPPNWPCPGDNNIQCCVKYIDMANSTSNSTLSTLITSSSQTPTADPDPSTESSARNLTNSQKGIIGGVVGAVVLSALVFILLILYRKWRHKRSNTPENDDGDLTSPRLPPGKETHMIDGQEKRELDANNTRYEIGNQVEGSRNSFEEPPVPDTGPTVPTHELPELPESVKRPTELPSP